MARPERFELPTAWFVARYSIQLSYGRFAGKLYMPFRVLWPEGAPSLTSGWAGLASPTRGPSIATLSGGAGPVRE